MSLAEIRFLQRKLKEKYGEVGVVAGKYLEAGFSVNVRTIKTPKGVIDIVAIKGREKLAIDVYIKSGKLPLNIVEEVYEKAKHIDAKPVLALWGRGVELDEDIIKKANELGVKIRRF